MMLQAASAWFGSERAWMTGLINFYPTSSHNSILNFLMLMCSRQKSMKGNCCLTSIFKSAFSGIFALLLSSCYLSNSAIKSFTFSFTIAMFAGFSITLVVRNSHSIFYSIKNSFKFCNNPRWYTTNNINGEL